MFPACAGNTVCPGCLVGFPTVHPRVCGEHVPLLVLIIHVTVHPRVCGEHQNHVLKMLEYHGSSPACAGNTPQDFTDAKYLSVHPRVCGEHHRMHILTIVRSGSSPRVRGTLLMLNCYSGIGRFIPACAGNTRGALVRHALASVHPRVCGEHS